MCSGVEKKKTKTTLLPPKKPNLSPCSLVKHTKRNYAVSSDSDKNITGLILENLLSKILLRYFCLVLF